MRVKSNILTIQYSRDSKSPLNLWSLRGRYIYWAAGTVGGGILSFLIGYVAFGFLVGLVLITSIVGFGGAMIFIKQHKGLHSKHSPVGVFILAHLVEHQKR